MSNDKLVRLRDCVEAVKCYARHEPGCVISAPAEAAPAPAPAPVSGEGAVLRAGFIAAANPLVKWLNDHPERLHPHHTVIVTQTGAELLEGSIGHKTTEFIKD